MKSPKLVTAATIVTPNLSGFDAYGNRVSEHAIDIETTAFDSMLDAIECLDPFQPWPPLNVGL